MSEVPIEIPEPQNQEDNLEVERPEWLPDKFNTPEDLAKSYSELESKLGQVTEQSKQQQEQWEQFLQEQEQERQQQLQQQSQLQAQQQYPQWREQLDAQYEQDWAGTVTSLAQQVAQQQIQQYAQQQMTSQQKAEETAALVAGEIAFRDATSRYSDWDNYKEAIVNELQDPELYPEQGFSNPATVSKYIDNAYAKAKLQALTTGQASLEQEAAQAAQNEKVNAQTISGAAGRPDSPNDDEEFYARLQKAARQTYSGWRGNA